MARIGEKRNAYRGFVGIPGGKRQLGRYKRRWNNKVKTDVK